jgi:hypothetical protein
MTTEVSGGLRPLHQLSCPEEQNAVTANSIIRQLPDNLVQRALGYCDTMTLLSSRLCCQQWAYTRHIEDVFRSLTLVPHLHLLQEFVATFDRSPLVNAVQSLLIDGSWLSWLLRITRASGAHLAPRMSPSDDQHSNGHNGLWKESWTGRLNEIAELHDTRDPALNTLLYDRMSAILKMLPYLREININFGTRPQYGGYWGWSCWPEVTCQNFSNRFQTPPCLRTIRLQAINLESLSDFPPRSRDRPIVEQVNWAMMTALVENHPQSLQILRLGNFDASRFFQESPAMVLNHLKPLLHHILELEIHTREPASPHGRQSLTTAHKASTALASLILAAPGLQALRLISDARLGCVSDDSRAYQPSIPSRLHTTSPDGHAAFAMLRHLWLQNIVCTPDSLLHFTVTECPQLTSLVIMNCALGSHAGHRLPPALRSPEVGAEPVMAATTAHSGKVGCCWVKFLKQLRRCAVNLAEIDFGGMLCNGRRQHWHIDPTLSPPSYDMQDFFRHPKFKQRVRTWFHCKYISDGLCPLNVFEIPDDVIDLGDPRILGRVSDESWEWTWPAHKCPWQEIMSGTIRVDGTVQTSGQMSDSDDETVC